MTLKGVRACLRRACNLDPMLVSSAFQAEENVVCNFYLAGLLSLFIVAILSQEELSLTRELISKAYLATSSIVVNPNLVVSEMPGAPTRSTADNMTAARQRVGSPRILGANPNSYFLRDIPAVNRMDMFNGFINLYMNGRFSVREMWLRTSGQKTQQLLLSCW